LRRVRRIAEGVGVVVTVTGSSVRRRYGPITNGGMSGEIRP
jgi:hypothetical protein